MVAKPDTTGSVVLLAKFVILCIAIHQTRSLNRKEWTESQIEATGIPGRNVTTGIQNTTSTSGITTSPSAIPIRNSTTRMTTSPFVPTTEDSTTRMTTSPFVPTTKEQFDIRLVDGPTHSEGRLEVHHNGLWGTVCDDGFDMSDAEVVCRQLHYDMAIDVKDKAYYGKGSGNIFLDNVDCNGDEEYLSQCRHSDWGHHDCNPNEDVGVQCTDTKGDIPIKLVPRHGKYKGYINAFYNGSWGAICNTDWSLLEADVSCRQLGFKDGAISTFSESWYYNSQDYVISEVSCTGNENTIQECSVHGIQQEESDVRPTSSHWWYTESPSECPRGRNAGVVCRKSAPGLTPGKIAGITVACLMFGILLIAVPLLVVRFKKPKDPPTVVDESHHANGDAVENGRSSQTQPVPAAQFNSSYMASQTVPSGSPTVAYGQNGHVFYAPKQTFLPAMNAQTHVVFSPSVAASNVSEAQRPLMVSHPLGESNEQNDRRAANVDVIPAGESDEIQGESDDAPNKDQTPLLIN